VIVPAFNAAATIGHQLVALLGQRWPPGFEVIVADNGSSDGTADVVRSLMRTDGRLRLVAAPALRGPAFARNAGAAAATSRYLAFCDADDLVSPGWVRAMGEALREHELVTGKNDVHALNPPAVARSRGLAVGAGPGRFGSIEFAHSCNMGIRKSVLESAGGWDPSVAVGEDIELCLRLWTRGVRVHFVAEAEVCYRHRTGELARWKQAVSYGAAHADLARRLGQYQLAAPTRRHALHNLPWLVRHSPDLFDAQRRPHWVWTAGLSAGHIRALARHRPAPAVTAPTPPSCP